MKKSTLRRMISIAIVTSFLNCTTHDGTKGLDDKNTEHATHTTPDELAYDYLYDVMDKYHNTFNVYTDMDAGGNHFIPSGWMGDWDDIIFDAGCTSNPHSGTTCIRIHYSAAGSQEQNWAGIYWQSPENNWGESKGYDLIGATRLNFWARGARGGEQIEFKLGGVNRSPHRDESKPYQDSFDPQSTGIITLNRSWQQYSIDLRGHDLSNVIGGFCWVTNIHQNPRGCMFYLDDISFDKTRLDAPRFLVSYQYEVASMDRYINNTAFLYDNAIVLLAFLARGTETDIRRANILADAFVDAQKLDRFFHDGRLRNAYQAGDLTDCKTGKVKLPGWWDKDNKRWFEDKYQVSSYTGNLAWAIIALTQFYKVNGESKYISAAEGIADWIFQNCYEGKGFGGYSGGYEGWEPNQMKLEWKSTEHNIDVWCAFMRLYQLTGKMSWKERAIHAKKFVTEMWDEKDEHFWTGTKKCDSEDNDIINKDVLPLDVNTWSLMAIGNIRKYLRAIEWAEENCFVDSCAKACGFKGFDFNNDKDGFWAEGTSQMCIAYQITGHLDRSEKLLVELRKLQSSATSSGGEGILAACHDGLSTGFDWIYNKRFHIAATAWFILAERGFNPYWGISTKDMIPYENIY